MTNNLAKYQKIINEFRGKVSNKNFEINFTAKSTHIPKTDRFILKMELKRLDGVCTRLIDLRGHVDGECRLYLDGERTHFLDDIAIKVFEENIALYGKYTLGVYEAVINTENNFRVIYQKEKSDAKPLTIKKDPIQKTYEKTQYPAQYYHLGDYHNRIEERMNFSIAIRIITDKDEIPCNSTDISINGCKLRVLTNIKMVIGQAFKIHFMGLEHEFTSDANSSLHYEIKNIQLIDNIQLIGLQRIYPDDNKNNQRDPFTRFIDEFIQINKRRYKINLDNTITALLSRNFEQYILPKLNELPVFIENEKQVFTPKYALTTPNNQQIYQYWQDENKHSTLNFLLSHERIQRLIKAAPLGEPLLVYSFIHKNQDKYYFYTADTIQLKTDLNLMKQFLGFSANKANFAISLLSIQEPDKNTIHSVYTLSESLSEKSKYLNMPISEENTKKIEKLSYLIVINDITTNEFTKTYREYAYDTIEPSYIKSYGHKRSVTPIVIEELGINYKDHRHEARFKYKTLVEVVRENLKLSAKSIDFSASGLKIEFTNETVLDKGDVVFLSFPDLQKVTSAFKLNVLPYEIVRINSKKTIINLRVYVEKHQHIGRAFFKALIEKNRDKLTPDEYSLIVPGLAKPLRNLYNSSLDTLHLIVQTSGSRYKVEAIASANKNGKLMALMRQLSDQKNTYNLFPILSHLAATNILMGDLQKRHASDAPSSMTLYIALNLNEKTIQKKVITKLSTELNSAQLQNNFIKKALKTGEFICLQLKLSRTDEPDMEYLNPELSYISSYAIHRGKQIEQEIWAVSGVIQVLDVSQEAILRMKLAV